jgi:hypothetical protein
MRANLLMSAIAHVALLVWYLVSFADPQPFDAVAVEPVTVDLVPAEQVDTPSSLSPRPPIDIPELRPTPDQQAGTAHNPSLETSSKPMGPQQTPPLESQSQRSSNTPQVGELVLGPRVTEPVQYSTSVNLAEAPSSGFDSPSESAAILSTSEIAAFKMQIQKCWNAPIGVANTEKLHVVLRLALARDGALTTRPALIEGSASPHGPALVESAIRALRQCQPYRFLPQDRYEEWKVLDLPFSPNGVSGG